MHLLVIGHTAHYEREGQIVGWGPTVREVCWLSRVFARVTHLACWHEEPAPDSALPYDTDKVQFAFVPPAGGPTVEEKARVLLTGPQYVRSVQRCLRSADVVQVRCPGSLGMYGMLLTSLWRGKKWAKYAGNWAEPGAMPLSHRFQRNWLRSGAFGGAVTVNGGWPKQREHVHAFDNPSLSLSEIVQARTLVGGKVLQRPVRLVFVGRTAAAKGLGVALRVVKGLLDGGVGAQEAEWVLDILGDGPERLSFERQSREMGLDDVIHFHGWVPHERVFEALREAHLILLPSRTEGWPKVLSEAMACGCVPLASRVSAIPQVLAEVGSGAALAADDVSGFVDAIRAVVHDPATWRRMVKAGLRAAPRFSYERYLIRLDEMLGSAYGPSPFDPDVMDGFRMDWEASVAEGRALFS